MKELCGAVAWDTGAGAAVSTCREADGHLGDHFDCFTGKRWENDPLNYPPSTEPDITMSLARQLAESFTRDSTGRSATALIQQAVHDFDSTHVISALGVLTGVLARVLGDVYPGGPDALFATLFDTPPPTEETPDAS